MKPKRTLMMLSGMALLLAGCHPVIYEYRFGPAQTIGPNESAYITWKVKGQATLLISDEKYDSLDTGTLAPVMLSVKNKKDSKTYRLVRGTKLKIPVLAEDSVVVSKVPDSVTDARIRTFSLVVSKNGADSSRRTELQVLPDSAVSEIGFRRNQIMGDTLVAAGINNPVRWGKFVILSVRDGSSRPLEVIHGNIRRTLVPGGPPDHGFEGTPVRGPWEFRGLETASEKADPAALAKSFKIIITVKSK